jgi:hypothetical protein
MISVTEFGMLWVILSVISLLRRDWFIAAIVASGVFQASAVINIQVGAQVNPVLPYYFMAILASAVLALNLFTGRTKFVATPDLKVSLELAGLFVLYAAASLSMPLLYSGVRVYTPEVGYVQGYHEGLAPLRLNTSMVGQLGYLILNFLLILFFLGEANKERAEKNFTSGLVKAAIAVSVISGWQLASRFTGIFYPTDFLYSAGDWAIHDTVTMAGVPRINGTFTEVSYAAAYLVGFFAFALRLWLGRRDRKWGLLVLLTGILLLMTTSTTAYLALPVVLMVLVFELLLMPAVMKGHLRKGGAIFAVLFIVAIIAVSGALSTQVVHDLIEVTVTDKTSGISFMYRWAADVRAGEIFFETYGLGVGIGGNYTSSFLMLIAGNHGAPGLLLFFGFLIFLSRASIQTARIAPDKNAKLLITAALYGLWMHVLAQAIAVPPLAFAPLWIWVGFLVTLTVALRRNIPNVPTSGAYSTNLRETSVNASNLTPPRAP